MVSISGRIPPSTEEKCVSTWERVYLLPPPPPPLEVSMFVFTTIVLLEVAWKGKSKNHLGFKDVTRVAIMSFVSTNVKVPMSPIEVVIDCPNFVTLVMASPRRGMERPFGKIVISSTPQGPISRAVYDLSGPPYCNYLYVHAEKIQATCLDRISH
jgi:hypothetical protein